MFNHCMKEEKFVTKFMSMFGTLDEVSTHGTVCRTRVGEKRFYYSEPMSWHNKLKHYVDDHSQRRHSPVDLAEVWKTQWWPHQQLSFLLTISEVSAANLRGCAKDGPAESMLKTCNVGQYT